MQDPQERVIGALSRAEDAVSRLDERVRICAFREGWNARVDFSEAVAWGWSAGSVASAEDLILHDENMDVRMPDEALRAAYGVVRARRKAALAGPELLSPAGASWLAGRRRREPPPLPSGRGASTADAATEVDEDHSLLGSLVASLDRLRSGATESADAAVGEWLGLLEPARPEIPLLLQAAVALEGWRIVEAYPREGYLGGVLVSHWLRDRKRVRSHLLGLEAGFRAVMRRSRPSADLPTAERILFWLAVIAEGAAQGSETLNRLELARQVAVSRMGTRRAHSHLGALIALLLERPVVTGPMAAQRLGVTPQSARRLIGELGGTVTEISGQTRYRAWRL
jgi:hypothetical protein